LVRASSSRRGIYRFLGTFVATLALLVAAAVPATAAELMRITFIRHGESGGNASGLIDTSTPGPGLTDLGKQQAQDVADLLGINNYDGIYASTMVRTQQTAGPMSSALRLPIQVLNGLQEIEAGDFEGAPENASADGYGRYIAGWALQGALDMRIPGGIDGHEFDARFDEALQEIYDNGDRNAAVFSHGGAIMVWTMVNAKNLTVAQKLQILQTWPLGNTDYVVVEGNNEDGWTLVSWNGQQFSTEPTLANQLALQSRTLVRQLAAASANIGAALATGDFTKVVKALGQSISDATYSIVKFERAAVNAIGNEVKGILRGKTPAPEAPAAAVNASSAGQQAAATELTSAEPAAAVQADAATAPKAAGADLAKQAKAKARKAFTAKRDKVQQDAAAAADKADSIDKAADNAAEKATEKADADHGKVHRLGKRDNRSERRHHAA